MDTRPGKRPRYPTPASGPCWVCDRPSRWSRHTATWHGKDYCWRHHPEQRNHYPRVNKSPRTLVYVRAEDEKIEGWAHRWRGVYYNDQDITKAQQAKLEREIRAKRGMSPSKPAKPRKRPRDRRYVR